MLGIVFVSDKGDDKNDGLSQETAVRTEPLFTLSGKGIDTDAALRMAHAFEYIAAQLGEINRKLSRLTR